MRTSRQSAMNLFEVLFFVSAFATGTLGALLAARWIGWAGYPLGFVVGVVIFPGSLYGVVLLSDLIWWGRPTRPVCRSGKCQSDDYELRPVGDGFEWFCRCGVQYRKQRPRFYEVRPDGSLAPYMKWKAFRGWVPDSH